MSGLDTCALVLFELVHDSVCNHALRPFGEEPSPRMLSLRIRCGLRCVDARRIIPPRVGKCFRKVLCLRVDLTAISCGIARSNMRLLLLRLGIWVLGAYAY